MRSETWIVPLVVVAFGLAVVLGRADRSRTAPTPKIESPRYVEPPLPLEPPFSPLKQANSELPPDVDDVLARKCRRCHTIPARNGAPFPLYTWADTRGEHHGKPIHERLGLAVQSGFMPNLVPANPPVERLTDEEKRTLLDWVAAGAPRAAASASASGSAARRRRPPAAAPLPSPKAPGSSG